MKSRFLKGILATALLFVYSEPSSATGMSLGFGLSADWGILGLGLDQNISDRGHIYGNVGLDVEGRIIGLGFKHEIYSAESNGHWSSKCLFLFDCTSRILIGADFKSFSKIEVTKRSGDGDQARYAVGPKVGIGTTVTLRDDFKSGLFWDFDISYRQFLDSPTVGFLSGIERTGDRDNLTTPHSGFGFGFSLGYWF